MKKVFYNKIAIILYLTFFGIFISCCQQNITNGSDIVFPAKNVSFLHHVYPFMQVTCSYASCHSDESQAGGIRLTDYFSLFQTPGIIVAGNPNGSLLVQFLNRPQNHTPLVYWKADSNQINGIKQWILEGAHNN